MLNTKSWVGRCDTGACLEATLIPLGGEHYVLAGGLSSPLYFTPDQWSELVAAAKQRRDLSRWFRTWRGNWYFTNPHRILENGTAYRVPPLTGAEVREAITRLCRGEFDLPKPPAPEPVTAERVLQPA